MVKRKFESPILKLLLLCLLVISCEQVEEIGVNGEQEAQVGCQDCSTPLENPDDPEKDDTKPEDDDGVICTSVYSGVTTNEDCSEAKLQLNSCNGSASDLDLVSNMQLSAMSCIGTDYRCESWSLVEKDYANFTNVFECENVINLTEAQMSPEDKLAVNLYKDFLDRDPSDAEQSALSASLSSNRSGAILDFLRSNEVVRRRVAEWRKEIWFDDESIAELAQSNKINRLLSGYGNGTNNYELIAREYYDPAYWDRNHLNSLRLKLNIGIPFGVLWYDYVWVWLTYPGVHQKGIDSQGARFYSQIANNISKRQMTYTIMNHNSGETHYATAAKWYKRYMKRSETIAELKGLVEVQNFAQNNLSNNNYRDVRALASLLNSNAYIDTYVQD